MLLIWCVRSLRKMAGLFLSMGYFNIPTFVLDNNLSFFLLVLSPSSSFLRALCLVLYYNISWLLLWFWLFNIWHVMWLIILVKWSNFCIWARAVTTSTKDTSWISTIKVAIRIGSNRIRPEISLFYFNIWCVLIALLIMLWCLNMEILLMHHLLFSWVSFVFFNFNCNSKCLV